MDASGRAELRSMKIRLGTFFLITSVVSPADGPDPQDIVRRAFLKDADIINASRDYTYLRRRVVTEFGKNGVSKVAKDETDEILVLYGRPYERQMRRDGKDLSARDTAREEEKLSKELARRKKGADKTEARERKEMDDRRKAIIEVSNAFDFRLDGVTGPPGRLAWLIDATPKPGFKPESRAGKIYPKLSGRLWIDQADHRLVKVEANVNEKISFGWFILQLLPGAVFKHERIRLDDAVWLPKRDLAKGEAKIGGMKTIRAEVETTYSNYRRFQVESTIRQVSEK